MWYSLSPKQSNYTRTNLHTQTYYTIDGSIRKLKPLLSSNSWQLANFQLARSSNPVPLKDKRRVLSVPVTECSIIGIPKNLQKDWSPLYKKARIAPLIEDYPFNIPHGFMAPLPQPEVGIDNLLESVVDMAMIIEPTKDDLVVHTVSPYCPVPDIFIPHKYRNIIPPNPLFDDNDSFITPGSQEWFTFMYNLEKNMSQEDRAIAIEAIVYEKHVDLRRLLEDNERERLKKEQDAIIQAHDEAQRLKNVQQALYHGTTPKYLPWRTGLSNKLTRPVFSSWLAIK
ncbi:uncharacterized protein OCT59_000335 [Rhizophagus irregularis]|uniref:uncharacterized protein n=1 Tax=Rhizophagus irregularis TaxID=588596 RepID=UPI00331B9A1A|nr:hypothetical protein OCT59_000335 [Rhizophagus irregularis]